MVGGLEQGKELGNDGGVCLTLNALIGADIDPRHQDCLLGGLPKKGLVAASLKSEGFYGCGPTCGISKNQDSSMSARVVFVWPSWNSKGCSAPDRVVLACLLMSLGFDKDVDFSTSL